MATDKDILQDARERFQASVDTWSLVRDDALEDMRFALLAEQWPADVLESRKRASRPCLTINKMKAFIRQVVNDARQNKPSIKVRPVDSGADVQTAEVINGIFRSIEHVSHADVAYDTAVEQATSGAMGFIRIDVDYACDDTFDLDIFIQRIANQFSVHFPADTEAADSSDWMFAFIEQVEDRKKFEAQYPGAQAGGFGDDDKVNPWFTDNTVRKCEYFDRTEVEKTILMLSDGNVIADDAMLNMRDIMAANSLIVTGERKIKSYKVTHYLLTAADVLETTPWLGSKIPIAPCYGEEFNIEGKRYFRALTHDAKDPQRMFNYWRTAATELVALAPKAPWIGTVGAFKTDKDKWATANTESHAYLRYDGTVEPKRNAFAGIPAGALQEALNSSDDMKAVIGLYDASLGARSNETSGVAINARKTEGDVNTFHFIDNLTRCIRCVGEIVLDLIPNVYNKARIVRVLGEDGQTANVRVAPGGQPEQQEDGSFVPVFDLTAGKYDLVVEAGPGFTTKRAEAAEQMMELIRSFPESAPVIGDLIAKNLDWPGADEIAERLKAMLPPQLQGQQAPQGPDPEAQAAQAAAGAKAQTAQAQSMAHQVKAEASVQGAQTQAIVDEAEAAAKAKRIQQQSAIDDAEYALKIKKLGHESGIIDAERVARGGLTPGLMA